MKKTKRNPEYKGSGIYVHQQRFKSLIKGDTFCDADFGYVIWDGSEWQSNNNQKVKINKQ